MSVEFKYRDGHNRVVSLRADRCNGLHTYGTSYEEFYLKGKKVGQVAESRLLPGYKEKASRLYAKPWRDKLKAYTEINLHERDFNLYGGLPKDAERIWGVNGDRGLGQRDRRYQTHAGAGKPLGGPPAC